MFTVAIIGRPNVGKSTLFNRLTGKPHALVEDTPGVTRDWRMGDANIADMLFRVLDTAGLEDAKTGTLQARMTEQTLAALAQADVALLVVDGRAGILPDDEHFARLIRRSGKPLILASNKTESQTVKQTALADAQRLGLGEPILLSAAHGEGLGELYDALRPFRTDEGDEGEELDTAAEQARILAQALLDEVQAEALEGREAELDQALATVAEADLVREKALKVVILGRPNAGKSTLLNALLGENRVLTGPEAGITRDAIAVDWQWQGRPIQLVDTAGVRKRANVTGNLEKMAVGDSLRSLRYAHVAVLLLDAQRSFEKQDLALADLIAREGRALVIGINKWDLVSKDMQAAYMDAVQNRLEETLPFVEGVPVVCLSAQKQKGVDQLLRAVLKSYELWNHRIPTGELNRFLMEATERHAPPMVSGRRFKFRFMTQVKTRPPTFAMFGNFPDKLPAAYERYLVRGLREVFGLDGIPLRFLARKPKNPYAHKKKK
jgi:GTP-binding protein